MKPPKEKAHDIVSLFRKMTTNIESSKECAKICLNQIIQFTDNELILEYLNEVEQEIINYETPTTP